MSGDEEERIRQAAMTGGKNLAPFLHDPSPRVLRALIGNSNLSEDDILIIAERNSVPADILQAISRDKRWAESYPVRLALAKNPKTPISVSLTAARYLRIFDLEKIALNNQIPPVFRNKVEEIIIEKLPAMELGKRKALARIAAGNVLLALLQDVEPDVVRICLDNPHLVEAHLFKVITRRNTVAGTIQIIADHPKWSTRTLIRLSLVRNPHTPAALAAQFVRAMRSLDLRELHADPHAPAAVRIILAGELRKRGIKASATDDEQVYEFSEEEIEDLLSEETSWEDDGGAREDPKSSA